MAVLSIMAGVLSGLYGIGWYLYIKGRIHQIADVWWIIALLFSCAPFIPVTGLLLANSYVWALVVSVVVVINTTIQIVQFRRLNSELL